MRKYKIDEKFFDCIDSEHKAYFLGLLLADGHNNVKDGVVSIDLQEGDIKILEDFTAVIQPTKPVRNYENKYSTYDRSRMVLANRYISDRLLELGMVQDKSKYLKFPKDVPQKLMSHFIRGYFDGDGSIGVYGKSQNVEFSIVSTKEFLIVLQQHLIDNCSLSLTKLGKRHKDRESNAYHIKYTGRYSCIRIRDFLYSDANVFLKRKHIRFFSIPDSKK